MAPRRTARGLAGTSVIPLALTLAACGAADCESIGYSGLAIRVQDANGEQVCDAVVTVSDGDFSEVLTASDTSGDCIFFGAAERAGTYRIDAVRGDAAGAVDAVAVVRTGECDHLRTEQVAVELSD